MRRAMKEQSLNRHRDLLVEVLHALMDQWSCAIVVKRSQDKHPFATIR